MILTHESGAQEDQFDEKNGGQKSRDTIPLSSDASVVRGMHDTSIALCIILHMVKTCLSEPSAKF